VTEMPANVPGTMPDELSAGPGVISGARPGRRAGMSAQCAAHPNRPGERGVRRGVRFPTPPTQRLKKMKCEWGRETHFSGTSGMRNWGGQQGDFGGVALGGIDFGVFESQREKSGKVERKKNCKWKGRGDEGSPSSWSGRSWSGRSRSGGRSRNSGRSRWSISSAGVAQ
jgi:hypothetical protein